MKTKKATKKLERAASLLKDVLEDSDPQAAPFVRSASDAVKQALEKLQAAEQSHEKSKDKKSEKKKSKSSKAKKGAKPRSKK